VTNTYKPSINPDMIAIARESRRLTQSEFASKLGIPQGYLSKIEAGILPINEDMLSRIAAKLGYRERLFFQDDASLGAMTTLFFH